MNRPQFFFKTPPGFRDESFVRPVNIGQDISGVIPAGQFVNNFVIQMDQDAPQIIRSLFVEGAQQDENPNLHIQLRDAYGNFLTDGYIPLWLYADGAGSTSPDGGSGRAKVFEPELYCPPGSVLIADFFSPGGVLGIPTYAGPSRQSLTHTAVQLDLQAVGGAGQGSAVIKYGGNLYQVLQFTGVPFPGGEGSVNVFRSTDGGLHWNILDGANSPVHSAHGDATGGVYYDGANTITIASTVGSVISTAVGPILLQDFDLVSGTWGAVYGAGSGNVYQTNQIYKRSDGSILVIAVDAISPERLEAYVFSGGAWSHFSLASLLPGGWVSNGLSSTVYDSITGTIHMFGIAFVGGVTKKQYYQQILLGNTVAGFQDLTGVYLAAAAMGNPIIVGGKLCWGVVDAANTFATILVGSPLSAPVFSVAPSPGILPGQPIPGFPNTLQPTLCTDGVNIWAVFLAFGLPDDVIYLSFTSNLSNPMLGWSGGIIYDDPLGTLNGVQYPSIAVLPGSLAPVITVQGQEFGQPTNFFFSPSGPLSPTTYPPYMELRGVKRYKDCSQ